MTLKNLQAVPVGISASSAEHDPQRVQTARGTQRAARSKYHFARWPQHIDYQRNTVSVKTRGELIPRSARA